MTYAVKEIYRTLQGEGYHTGRPAVFLRFAGCNLWSGREDDREGAQCRFCDTDFVGVDGPHGGHFATAADVARGVAAVWSSPLTDDPFVVCTGGEPLLQLDSALVDALHAEGFAVAVETNGTIAAPPTIDWLTVSPKARAPLIQSCGDELKLVVPQEGIDPKDLESLAFTWFFLQPMDGPARDANTDRAIQYCLEHPQWRVSLQTHKLLGLP